MTHPENTESDRLLRAIGHMAEASGLTYSLVQELAFLTHELAPMTGGPLEPVSPADQAYAAALNASLEAHRIMGYVAAVAAAFDTELAKLDGESPALTIVGAGV
jgi:hypothetical protein